MVDRLTRASELTVEEKASLTSGRSFWETEAVDRAGIPSIYLTDGPHGVRKQTQGGDHLGIGDSVPATCFPPAVALGSSWDAELLERVGAALGETVSAHASAAAIVSSSSQRAMSRSISASSAASRDLAWITAAPSRSNDASESEA